MKKEVIRTQIDNIDSSIISLLAERLSASITMGEIKRELALPIEDLERESSIIKDREQQLLSLLKESPNAVCIFENEKHISDVKDAIKEIYNIIFRISKSLQE